jgi:hypothetical protein
MKFFKTQVLGLQLNIINRDLLLILVSAAAIALSFGTLVVMAVSRL